MRSVRSPGDSLSWARTSAAASSGVVSRCSSQKTARICRMASSMRRSTLSGPEPRVLEEGARTQEEDGAALLAHDLGDSAALGAVECARGVLERVYAQELLGEDPHLPAMVVDDHVRGQVPYP